METRLFSIFRKKMSMRKCTFCKIHKTTLATFLSLGKCRIFHFLLEKIESKCLLIRRNFKFHNYNCCQIPFLFCLKEKDPLKENPFKGSMFKAGIL